MAKKILQINLRFNIPAKELAKEFLGAATPISSLPGLKWKIFGINEERSEGAGFEILSRRTNSRQNEGAASL